jgi:GMP synthase (glutamine-hydrolysing)
MRKLLVFQHVPFEPLGTLDRQFKDAGFRIRYANFHRGVDRGIAVGRYHGLVVLGGPMSANETDRHPHLQYEQEAIHEAIELNLPVLGICLGAQLIAATLGGRTLRGRTPEYGWCEVRRTDAARDDPLLQHFDACEHIFQWHADTFTLPGHVTQLARSDVCEHQAFRYGDSVYGLQFHLEADHALIRRWLGTPQHLHGPQRLGAAIDRDRIERETELRIGRATELAARVFGAFIAQFYRWRRRIALPSR